MMTMISTRSTTSAPPMLPTIIVLSLFSTSFIVTLGNSVAVSSVVDAVLPSVVVSLLAAVVVSLSVVVSIPDVESVAVVSSVGKVDVVSVSVDTADATSTQIRLRVSCIVKQTALPKQAGRQFSWRQFRTLFMTVRSSHISSVVVNVTLPAAIHVAVYIF